MPQFSHSQPASLLDNDDDFGDFAGPAVPVNTVAPPAPDNNQSWTFPALNTHTKPVEKLPAVAAAPTTLSGSDRYSAIRDLLGDDSQLPLSQPLPPQPSQPSQPIQSLPLHVQNCQEEDDEEDFGDFAEFTSPPPVTSTSPDGFPSFPGSLRPQLANLESLFSSGPPVIPSTSSNKFSSHSATVKSPADQTEELDMWSLPSGQCQVPDPLPTPSQIFHSSQPPPPFLSSSPPPSPGAPQQSSDLNHLNVEEFALPSDQFGFSEQEIFGIKKQKKVKDVQKPQSIQDVLSLSKESKQRESHIISTDRTECELGGDHTEPTSPISVSSSPEKKSSTAASEAPKTTATDHQVLRKEIEKEPSPYHEWLLILTEIRSLFDCVLNTFNDIFNEDLKEDLVTNPEGKAYLENLSLVLKVYKRIGRSCQSKLSEESRRPEMATRLNQLMAEIDLSWASVEDHCKQYRALSKVWDEEVDGGQCGVCLCAGACLVYSSSRYHPECANYWVNCVTDSLPSLSQ